ITAHARRDRKTLRRVTDRRLQGAVETEAPMRLQYPRPGLDGARHRDRMDGIERDRPNALREQHFGFCSGGGATGTVIAPRRLARLRNDAEAIAADAGHA